MLNLGLPQGPLSRHNGRRCHSPIRSQEIGLRSADARSTGGKRKGSGDRAVVTKESKLEFARFCQHRYRQASPLLQGSARGRGRDGGQCGQGGQRGQPGPAEVQSGSAGTRISNYPSR